MFFPQEIWRTIIDKIYELNHRTKLHTVIFSEEFIKTALVRYYWKYMLNRNNTSTNKRILQNEFEFLYELHCGAPDPNDFNTHVEWNKAYRLWSNAQEPIYFDDFQ